MDEGHRIFKRFKESQRIPKATNGGGDNSLLMFICLNLIEKKTHVRLCSWKSNILRNVMIFRLYDLLFIIFSVLFFLFFSFFYATRFFSFYSDFVLWLCFFSSHSSRFSRFLKILFNSIQQWLKWSSWNVIIDRMISLETIRKTIIHLNWRRWWVSNLIINRNDSLCWCQIELTQRLMGNQQSKWRRMVNIFNTR